ncbi:protein of unknown function [Mucilaginibacter lappiensis]|uniref:DUF885 domain-containing protein n=1 Tax=Mucilaginibacter lappiensis TaxID=354630 RepID=A0ABR6PDZ8_9SPHI|nr:DUF885 family protein [Mucilaginibacter lappiensis]MBB6107993.1 hypothetical protein [Mucilaginibacter lappiensis]SIP90180.1 protein of unknown function [Mucilaginibacter lappiensis]
MFTTPSKGYFTLLITFSLTIYAFKGKAQTPNILYEQTSETAGLITRYGQDISAIKDFYSPYNVNEHAEYQYKMDVLNSPEQRKRLTEVNNDYLKQLDKTEFSALSIYGKVDYILLKKKINFELLGLKKEDEQYKQITKYISFADGIYALEQKRRRGTYLEGEKVADELNTILKELKTDSSTYHNLQGLDMPLAKMTRDALLGLKGRLKDFYNFYNTYDPNFTWWVPEPYKVLDKALQKYSDLAISKGKINTTQKADGSGIKGVPIGRQELINQLQAEMIPYTPEELIKLANKEFAWCDKEMLKASQEMGFGNDWKKALEKVKNSYVPVGHQPALIVKLYNDAISFIKERDLITIPPLAEETWGMVMMSPERQLVNPFFTGGKEISISYPTNTMQLQDRLMSMRGNNPYFSRGTVQHELIPGHNLQYFMNSRYKSYRQDFTTPFAIEGWALYWELLLYDKGFAKTPEERVGMLFWRMHRCARIIFSLNYHLGNWTPQQCIDFLVDRVGHERANAEGEVRRSFKGDYSPLYQVAYLLGGLQLMELKKEMVDSGKMTYKQFHDAAIKENLIPVEMLRATLTNQPLSKDFTTSWKFYDFNK